MPEKTKRNQNTEVAKAWRLKNRDHLLEVSNKWNKDNKEKLKEYRLEHREVLNERSKLWQKENKEKAFVHRKKWLDSNPIERFKSNLRNLIGGSFKRGKISLRKKEHTESILGCSFEFFLNYILEKCPEGIDLSNFSRHGYHIDHIIPISIAKNEDDVFRLCHYTNLQPLWWKDNILKSNKLL